MKKKHLTLLSLLLITVISITVYSCTCSSCGRSEEAEIPNSIVEAGNKYIISKTGSGFFEGYISPDFSLSTYAGGYYDMVYRFIIPEKNYVDELIRFTLDSTGAVVKDREISGIPDCVKNPESCRFEINEEQARSIAAESGLEKGVNEWKIGFMWDSALNQYVWHVLNTLYESEGSNGYIGNGKEVVIDPATGLILRENKWNIR